MARSADSRPSARSTTRSATDDSDRRIRLIGGLIVGLIVIAILAAALWTRRDRAGYDDAATLPSGVSADYGVPFAAAKAGVPTLEIWEDFQCPACGAFESVAGAHIRGLAEKGLINLIWRPTAFLDDSPAVRQANRDNDAPQSSARAIAAWGCAIDQGVGAAFHDALFAVQPQEGRGYPTDLLLSLGRTVGLSTSAQADFQTCVEDQTYLSWARNATLAFRDAGVQGTPTVLLAGREISLDQAADAATLERLVAEATK